MRAPQQGRALRPVGLARGRGHAGEHGGRGTRCYVLVVAFEFGKKLGAFKGDDGWHSRLFSVLFLHVLSCPNFPQNTGKVGVTLSRHIENPRQWISHLSITQRGLRKAFGDQLDGMRAYCIVTRALRNATKRNASIHFLVKL